MLREREVIENADSVDFKYTEKYVICTNCKEEIYVGEIHDSNLEKFNKAIEEAKN